MDVWMRYNGLAETDTSEAVQKATTAIQAANFTIPLDVPKTPADKDGKRTGDDPSKPSDAKRVDPDAKDKPDDGADAEGAKNGSDTNPMNAHRADGPEAPVGGDPAVNAANAGRTDGSGTPPGAQPFPISQAMSGAGSMGGASSSGGSSGGGGGSGMSGLGSAFKAAVQQHGVVLVVDADFPRVVDALGTLCAVFVVGGLSDVESGVEFPVGLGVGDECHWWWEFPAEHGFSGVSAVGDAAGAARSSGWGCSSVWEWPGRCPALGARGRCWRRGFSGRLVERGWGGSVGWRCADDAAGRDGWCCPDGSV
jgi:hypothetical protein